MKFRSTKAMLPRTSYLTVFGKMTEPEGVEDENESAGCITSLNINSTDSRTSTG